MTAAEIYELLCVPDLELNDLSRIVTVMDLNKSRIPEGEMVWLLRKCHDVKIEIVERDPEIEKLKQRAKEHKGKRKALPPADDKYTDYTT